MKASFKNLRFIGIFYRVLIMESGSPKRMRMRSRNTQNADLKKSSEEDENPKSVDLSKFKLESSKQKLQTVSKRKRQHVSVEYDDDVAIEKPKSSSVIEDEDDPSKPKNWKAVVENLRKMRSGSDAPVDTMGCDNCHDESATPEDQRYQKLISLMLSSQTKDQVNHVAMTKLKEHGCSLINIINTSDEILGQLIYPVSFWKTKVKHIKKSSEMIRDVFDGDIPKTVEDLCKLPGVGPKMAHLCMNTAWGEITGIGVDTHVHRISNRLGWVKTKQPEATRVALEKWLPRDLWKEINHILVGFGQTVCKPIGPQCTTCLNNKLCPFGIKEVKEKKCNKK